MKITKERYYKKEKNIDKHKKQQKSILHIKNKAFTHQKNLHKMKKQKIYPDTDKKVCK